MVDGQWSVVNRQSLVCSSAAKAATRLQSLK
jgi:hypothetical protein